MKLKKVFYLVLLFLILLVSNSFAYNLELIGTNGQKYNVNNFKGKIVVMTFFDIGCYYCQKEVPTLNRLYDLYARNQKNIILLVLIHLTI